MTGVCPVVLSRGGVATAPTPQLATQVRRGAGAGDRATAVSRDSADPSSGPVVVYGTATPAVPAQEKRQSVAAAMVVRTCTSRGHADGADDLEGRALCRKAPVSRTGSHCSGWWVSSVGQVTGVPGLEPPRRQPPAAVRATNSPASAATASPGRGTGDIEADDPGAAVSEAARGRRRCGGTGRIEGGGHGAAPWVAPEWVVSGCPGALQTSCSALPTSCLPRPLPNTPVRDHLSRTPAVDGTRTR